MRAYSNPRLNLKLLTRILSDKLQIVILIGEEHSEELEEYFDGVVLLQHFPVQAIATETGNLYPMKKLYSERSYWLAVDNGSHSLINWVGRNASPRNYPMDLEEGSTVDMPISSAWMDLILDLKQIWTGIALAPYLGAAALFVGSKALKLPGGATFKKIVLDADKIQPWTHYKKYIDDHKPGLSKAPCAAVRERDQKFVKNILIGLQKHVVKNQIAAVMGWAHVWGVSEGLIAAGFKDREEDLLQFYKKHRWGTEPMNKVAPRNLGEIWEYPPFRKTDSVAASDKRFPRATHIHPSHGHFKEAFQSIVAQ